VVIVVNAVASSTPMAETVGGLALLTGENGVPTLLEEEVPTELKVLLDLELYLDVLE
jgi:hypothetical protein